MEALLPTALGERGKVAVLGLGGLEVLPNLLIAGVPKAGTTSLFRALAAHPDIFGSSVKETEYFTPLLAGGELAPIEEYERHFGGSVAERYRLEATPEYFYGGEALIDQLKALLGELRVVLVFREPRSRLVSFYRFNRAHMHLPADLTIEGYVAACESALHDQSKIRGDSTLMGIEGSLYDEYLPPWLSRFGDSLQVLFLDDLMSDPAGVLRRLADWLDIDPTGFASRGLTQQNRTTHFRWTALQRVALWAAGHAEGISQNHPRIYDRLVAAYYALNGKPFDERLSSSTTARLDDLFLPHKRRFARQLIEHGYSMFPEWLRSSVDPGSRLGPVDVESSRQSSTIDDR